ncbi:MAG: hypothetical protein WA962_10560 [Ornithinimicrobium sp.]
MLHSMLANPGAEEVWGQGPPRFGAPIAPDLAEAYLRGLGLSAGEVRRDLPLQVVDTGLPYLIVPVTTQGLAQAAVTGENFEELLALSGAKFVYVLDPECPEGRTWDNSGRVEDVATGSAAGPALAYLVHHGLCHMDTPATGTGALRGPTQQHRGPAVQP